MGDSYDDYPDQNQVIAGRDTNEEGPHRRSHQTSGQKRTPVFPQHVGYHSGGQLHQSRGQFPRRQDPTHTDGVE